MHLQRPHTKAREIPPDQQGLVDILADMVRSALAWGNDLGEPSDSVQCVPVDQVDGLGPGYTLSPQTRYMSLNDEVEEDDNGDPTFESK